MRNSMINLLEEKLKYTSMTQLSQIPHRSKRGLESKKSGSLPILSSTCSSPILSPTGDLVPGSPATVWTPLCPGSLLRADLLQNSAQQEAGTEEDGEQEGRVQGP